jgi:uncharacterized membrane protein
MGGQMPKLQIQQNHNGYRRSKDEPTEMDSNLAYTILLILIAILFIIIFIAVLQILFKVFMHCWHNINKCWFIPKYPLPSG